MIKLNSFIAPTLYLLGMVAAVPSTAFAEAIEIDWEVIVDAPSPDSISPQISIVMAATPSLSYDFAEFKINPHNYQQKGGAETVVWWAGESNLGYSSYNGGPLDQPDDVVRFTTVLDVVGSGTTYAISALSSKAWGSVPGAQLPTVSTKITGKMNFSLALTLAESEIEFGKNRVVRMAITEIRNVQGKKVSRDTTLRVIHERSVDAVKTEVSPETLDTKIAY